MSKNLEIEAKYIVSKDDFLKIKKHLKMDYLKPVKQVNIYLDTNTNIVQNNKWMLRVRIIDSEYELTLKKPIEKGIIEINKDIDYKTYLDIINSKIKIDELDDYVHKIGELETNRISMPYKIGEIFLDISHYNNIIDYEIEYEVNTSLEEAQNIIKALFNELDITNYHISESKVKRCCE